MGYIIQYEAVGKLPKQASNRKRGRWLVATVFLILVVSCCVLGLPEGWEAAFIPGNPEITKNAAVHLIQNVESGVHISQAFATFCYQIAEGDTWGDLA